MTQASSGRQSVCVCVILLDQVVIWYELAWLDFTTFTSSLWIGGRCHWPPALPGKSATGYFISLTFNIKSSVRYSLKLLCMNIEFKHKILVCTFLFAELSAQFRFIHIHLGDEIAPTGWSYPEMLRMFPVRMFSSKKHKSICWVKTWRRSRNIALNLLGASTAYGSFVWFVPLVWVFD